MSFSKVITYLLCGLIINFTSINAFASMKVLSNYDELSQVIESDSNIKALIYTNNCKFEKGLKREIPRIITFTTTNFTKFKDGQIRFGNEEQATHVGIEKNNVAIVYISFSQDDYVKYNCTFTSDPSNAGIILYNLNSQAA